MYDMRQVVVNYNLLAGQIKKELDVQFDSGRIKGTEYADVFNKLMSQAIGYAFDSPLKEQQMLQLTEQVGLTEAQRKDQEYVTEHIRPQEKMKLLCEIDLCRAQETLVNAQAADQEYVTEHIRPTEQQIKLQELEIAREKVEIARIETDIKQQELLIKQEELEIAREKLRLAEADVDYKIAQTAFTVRQTEGFDDNKKQKMLDAQLNAWAMMFSSGLLDQVPSVINGCYVDSLYIAMSNEVGIDPSGNCQTPATMSNNTAASNAKQGNNESIVSKNRKRK